jgi:hypothetical protein
MEEFDTEALRAASGQPQPSLYDETAQEHAARIQAEAEYYATLVRTGLTPNVPPEPDLIEAFHAALTDEERATYYRRIQNFWRESQGLPPI